MHRYGSREMYRFTASVVFGTLGFHLFGSIASRVFCDGTGFLPDYKHSDREEEGNGEGESRNTSVGDSQNMGIVGTNDCEANE